MERLNLGCGDYYVDGWLNVDVTENERVKPDVVVDIRAGLPFADGSFDMVYLGHVLEHLPLDDVVPVLAEVRRVVKPSGRVCVVGPDVGRTANGWNHIMPVVLHGGNRWDGDAHLWASTGEAHYFAALLAGFTVAELIDPTEVERDWPIPDRSPWQFALRLTP